jgi:hypothetical protein
MTTDASIGIFTLPALPDAARFPRMPDADLADLAEDIKTNGMSMPILVGLNDDGQPYMLDGISQHEVGRIAGIAAPVNTDAARGADAKALILGCNLHRRHQGEGQRTIMVAVMYPARIQGRLSERFRKLGPSTVADCPRLALSSASPTGWRRQW